MLKIVKNWLKSIESYISGLQPDFQYYLATKSVAKAAWIFLRFVELALTHTRITIHVLVFIAMWLWDIWVLS